MMHRLLGVGLLLIALAGAGCGGKPIVVGSKNSTEDTLLAEIAAQHLEHRLGRKVQRRLSVGGTPITYQEFQNNGISLYPEYTGAVETEILKEQPATDPSAVFERAKGEMLRLNQAELLPPLGINNTTVILVKPADALREKVETLSDAAAVKDGWKLGVTIDFDERPDGLPVLNSYRLPMSASVRSMDLQALFGAFAAGQFTMIAASATDGALAGHDWKVLRDDRHGFPPEQACFLVRQDALVAEPRLRAALSDLSGKFSNDVMRKLNAQVDVEHRPVAQVAAAFLEQAGLP
jgi:glycine betaine/choline ABC-type transport system substrate-binding protein